MIESLLKSIDKMSEAGAVRCLSDDGHPSVGSRINIRITKRTDVRESVADEKEMEEVVVVVVRDLLTGPSSESPS